MTGCRSLLWLVVACVGSAAEAEARTPESGPVVTIRQADEKAFPQIAVEFEVKAPGGEPILEATKDDFRVEEYDAPVAISSFQSPISREFRPTTVVLVLDTSGSMREGDRIGGLKRAVDGFLENLPDGSRVAVIAFNDGVELICPFTDDPDEVRVAVRGLTAGGKTVFYDAVTAAVRLLEKETGRRAILAMTDGKDNLSLESDLGSAIRIAQRAGLPVHTLGLGREEETSDDDLRDLAEETRGRAFSARQAIGLRSIFEEIARGLGQTYRLTYTTDHRLPDGTLRPIKVFYRRSTSAGVGQVYVAGMVVPAARWSWLFLVLLAGLAGLAMLPSWRRV